MTAVCFGKQPVRLSPGNRFHKYLHSSHLPSYSFSIKIRLWFYGTVCAVQLATGTSWSLRRSYIDKTQSVGDFYKGAGRSTFLSYGHSKVSSCISVSSLYAKRIAVDIKMASIFSSFSKKMNMQISEKTELLLESTLESGTENLTYLSAHKDAHL